MMSLTTLSASTIVNSAPLTKFAVTEHYHVGPGVLKKIISTQQSTWMEMALEDGGSAAALRGGVRCRLKIAAAALGGGGSRKIYDDGIDVDVGINVIEAKGLLLRHWC
jgi:hypothetical protein